MQVGDEVLTAGGILGKVTGVSEHYAVVKISDNTEVKLTGRALHDIHKSVGGEMDTPSSFPLATGLFAIAVRDTSEYNNVHGMWLWDPQLRVRTN